MDKKFVKFYSFKKSWNSSGERSYWDFFTDSELTSLFFFYIFANRGAK